MRIIIPVENTLEMIKWEPEGCLKLLQAARKLGICTLISVARLANRRLSEIPVKILSAKLEKPNAVQR